MTSTRYGGSVDPVRTDGRDIDVDLGSLTGEAAGQRVSGSSDAHLEKAAETWQALPEPQTGDPAYYDVPLLQEPVWEWVIPFYYYVGGVTGASLLLGAAAQFSKVESLRPLIRRCHWIGLIGSGISGVLLTYDLGRPERFLNMLRVFRPTSPMNMGAWILSGTGATATLTVLLRQRTGLLGWFGELSGYGAGVFGTALATYTGVLVANTAIPIWQESRKVLPVLFGCSALASLGCMFDIVAESADERRVTDVLGRVGRLAEIAAGVAMEHQASVVPRVGLPFSRGLSGLMWRTAEALTIASVVVSALPKQTRNMRRAAGLLGTAGSLLLRLTVNHMGAVSARDARASFHLQRAAKR